MPFEYLLTNCPGKDLCCHFRRVCRNSFLCRTGNPVHDKCFNLYFCEKKRNSWQLSMSGSNSQAEPDSGLIRARKIWEVLCENDGGADRKIDYRVQLERYSHTILRDREVRNRAAGLHQSEQILPELGRCCTALGVQSPKEGFSFHFKMNHDD